MLMDCNLFQLAMHFISVSPLIWHVIAFNVKIAWDPIYVIRVCKLLSSYAPIISYYKKPGGFLFGSALNTRVFTWNIPNTLM